MDENKNGWVLVGHCAVDSGQLMLCDPCYIKSHWTSNHFTSATNEDKNDFSYDGACVTTVRHSAGQLGNDFGTRYLGVASGTGGDGLFPVYVRFEYNQPKEMRVMFEGYLNNDGQVIDWEDEDTDEDED